MLQEKKLKVYTVETLGHTTELLALNPEFNAVWNFRRHILLSLFEEGGIDVDQAINDDLRMVMGQLKLYPKCYWIWNHRTWCLQELESLGKANWTFELGIVLKLLEADSRNFHGWHYRRYVVQQIESKAVKEAKTPSDKALSTLKIDLDEFRYTTQKITKNISNFSAWHNRSKLIPKIFSLIAEDPDRKTLEHDYREELALFSSPHHLLLKELEMVKTGMYMDPEDTSVWLYMKWLLSETLFVDDLKATNSEAYRDILRRMLADVEELNGLEKDDSPTNADNVWCLKLIIFIKSLINEDEGRREFLDSEIIDSLNRLIELDPLRKGHYLDQISGEAPVIC